MIRSDFVAQSAEEAAKLVCSQVGFPEAYTCYRVFKPLLRGWRFAFSSERGPTAGYAVNQCFSAGAVVRSLLQGERILVMDEIADHDIAHQGRVTYPISFSVSLDTQAISCIQPWLEARVGRLPQDFEEVFRFLAREEVNCDPMPYIMENLRNVRNPSNHEAIYRRLKGYEVLRSIDNDHLSTTGEVRSTFTESELNKNAQEALVFLLRSSDELGFRDVLALHTVLFCVLLKIVLIQLSSPHQGLATKLTTLLDFMHRKLCCIFTGEALLAYRYFLTGQRLRFFGKVQSRKRNLLNILDSMAWDLYHVRTVFFSASLDFGLGARYHFPALLTFDKPFAEILDCYALRACAFGPNSEFITVEALDLVETLSSLGEAEITQIAYFFSEDAAECRARQAYGRHLDHRLLAADLATELAEACGCEFDSHLDDLL